MKSSWSRVGVIVVILTVILGSPALLLAQDVIGTLSYRQGTVSIVRDGKVLSGRTVFNGMPIRNFDQLQVARSSSAEVKIDKNTGLDATLKLNASTTATLDITSLKKNQQGSIELIGGNIELKVARLTTGNGLNVKTGTATMGVRGTTFTVTIVPTGEALLATDEGRVECKTASGESFFSEPGIIVESTNDGIFGEKKIQLGGLESFRASWVNQKVDAFRADPKRAMAQQVFLYDKALANFTISYNQLNRQRAIITKWITQDQQGNIGGTAERMRDKKALFGILKDLRMAQNVLERANSRIAAIEEIVPGTAPNYWKNGQSQLQTRMAEVWYVTRLYAARNEGTFPLDFQEVKADDFFNNSPF